MKKLFFLGAGYANLSILKSLDDDTLSKAEFYLINNSSYHYKTTELHKLAAAEKMDNIKVDLKEILSDKITIIEDEVISFDDSLIVCKNDSYSYDEVYVGLGASKNTFNISGLEDTYEIGDYKNAYKTQDNLYMNLMNKQEEYKNVVICGAGFSGVELCGSIAKICKKQHLNANIYLVEAMDEILPMYSKELAQKARRYLENLGVKVLTSHKIIKKENDRIYLNDESTFIDSKNIIFTAGVKGNKVISLSGLENKNDRVMVDEYLKAPNKTNCYVIGDCSVVMNNDKPFAPTAQIACKQGEYLARAIKAKLNGEEFNEKFEYKDKGSVCSVGKTYAVACIGGYDISHIFAVVLKMITDKKWGLKIQGLFGLIS